MTKSNSYRFGTLMGLIWRYFEWTSTACSHQLKRPSTLRSDKSDKLHQHPPSWQVHKRSVPPILLLKYTSMKALKDTFVSQTSSKSPWRERVDVGVKCRDISWHETRGENLYHTITRMMMLFSCTWKLVTVWPLTTRKTCVALISSSVQVFLKCFKNVMDFRLLKHNEGCRCGDTLSLLHFWKELDKIKTRIFYKEYKTLSSFQWSS